ncbi:MAG: AraC family transcriptional regulator [Muribaculaceae bacterium]|nr:AraC family transcriptional regulator [Muribaculaceae bacterium]
MKPGDRIPEKRLTAVTDRRFMLRHDYDGAAREPAGRFHRDDYFLIGVVCAGRYSLSIDFQDFSVAEGNAVIICPGQVHAPLEDCSGEGFALALAPDLLSDKDLAAINELQLTDKITQLPASDLRDIVGLYEVLKRRNGTAGDAELALVSAIKSIVIANVRAGSTIVPHRYQRLAIAFRQLLEQNVGTVKSPAKYARMLSVSGVYLNEALKAATGKSVSRLIGEYVTTMAKRELCHTGRSAQEIANDLGYDDYSYFSRLFRRHAGMSPMAFRRKYLE